MLRIKLIEFRFRLVFGLFALLSIGASLLTTQSRSSSVPPYHLLRQIACDPENFVCDTRLEPFFGPIPAESLGSLLLIRSRDSKCLLGLPCEGSTRVICAATNKMCRLSSMDLLSFRMFFCLDARFPRPLLSFFLSSSSSSSSSSSFRVWEPCLRVLFCQRLRGTADLDVVTSTNDFLGFRSRTQTKSFSLPRRCSIRCLLSIVGLITFLVESLCGQ